MPTNTLPHRLTIAVERSGDTKLSSRRGVSATWASQASCPPCPLRKNGCYAETGNSGIHTHRLNKVAEGEALALGVPLDDPTLQRDIALQEAEGIGGLTGTRKLRVHVVGDCATNQAAQIVGKAMVKHQAKHGMAAWTYTHAWREVPHKAWQGASVLASCESPSDVKVARGLGYGTALIVPPHPSNKVYDYLGERVIPCPAQFTYGGVRKVTCEDCTLCQRPTWLRDNKVSIGFQPDGNTSKRVLPLLKVI